MIIQENKKIEIWEHILKKKDKIPNDIDQNNFDYIKQLIWNDDLFWMDVVSGHSLLERTPEELNEVENNIYEHFIFRFWYRVKNKIKK